MEILRKLGELFLDAVPTIILFFLFYWFLKANFFTPLKKVLAERDARITKARVEAEAIQASARDKVSSYEDALRKAKSGLFAEQEAARQVALEERAKLLRNARKEAQEAVRKEKERIARESEAARGQLEVQSTALAARITQRILERPQGPRAGAR